MSRLLSFQCLTSLLSFILADNEETNYLIKQSCVLQGEVTRKAEVRYLALGCSHIAIKRCTLFFFFIAVTVFN